MHHSCTKMLAAYGIDACKNYTQDEFQLAYDRVRNGDLVCTICGKKRSSTQRLRQHIAVRHLGKTTHTCR